MERSTFRALARIAWIFLGSACSGALASGAAAMGGVGLRGLAGASSTVSGQLRAPVPVGCAGRAVARLGELEYDNPMCDSTLQDLVTQPFAELTMG